ncbi:MAG: hypothetical protein HQL05_06185 [Nitrospirae bacterium]|uniref:hypothetical protein n=1 Tax=Candidatus Magnetobacterium casense TaxID=1455061 RepID=UPI00058BB05E|nr:hypothetical protein [Candidatus Magnetobacterium casensis]MBF0337404.1 hypothetical protein [Nitrospirota bacterium]
MEDLITDDTTAYREYIKAATVQLSPESILVLQDFVAFLVEKERKHDAFVQRVLEAEKEPLICFDSAEEAFNAIFDDA